MFRLSRMTEALCDAEVIDLSGFTIENETPVIFKEPLEVFASNQTSQQPLAVTPQSPTLGPSQLTIESLSALLSLQGSSRFHHKLLLTVGNTSRYLFPSSSGGTQFQYKWNLYVKSASQTSSDTQDISRLIKKVRFFLHPDYKPYDVIDVTSPPFAITRFGWGECPVRIQLHFWDNRVNKPVNAVHVLKFDGFRTGDDLVGAERMLEVELDKSTKLKDTHALGTAEHMDPKTSHLTLPTTTQRPKVSLDAETADLLNQLCKRFPLVRNSHTSATSYTYPTSPSYTHFTTTWTATQRTEAETCRARVLQPLLQAGCTSIVKLEDVVGWCREYGHTPLPDMVQGKYSRTGRMHPDVIRKCIISDKHGWCLVCGSSSSGDDETPCRLGGLVSFERVELSVLSVRGEYSKLDDSVLAVLHAFSKLKQGESMQETKMFVKAVTECRSPPLTVQTRRDGEGGITKTAMMLLQIATRLFIKELAEGAVEVYRREGASGSRLVPTYLHVFLKQQLSGRSSSRYAFLFQS